jgi:threonine dehydratase
VRHLSSRFPTARLREVPVVRASSLDRVADPSGTTKIWLALESLQMTGSFKVRGALHAMAAGMAEGATEFVAASAGNHGAGVAYAAAVLDSRVRVVVPQGASRSKCDRILALGGEVLAGPTPHYDDTETYAREIAVRDGVPFLSPYDSDLACAGNGSSLGFEIVRALGGVPDRVIVPFGGGGLASGLAWAFASEAADPPSALERVWGVQSDVSPVMAASLSNGAAIERFLPASHSLAEGLEGGISQAAYARAADAIAGIVVVEESQIAPAMAHLHKDVGMVVEGSAAIALVPVLLGLPRELIGEDVIVVLTGRNIDHDRWSEAVSW